MVARRPHIKSKLGCTECKRRRIKCGEERPDCSNCRRRNFTCSFHVFDPAPRSTIPVATGNKVSSRIHVFSQIPDDLHTTQVGHGLLDANVQAALMEDFPESSRSLYLSILQHFATNTIPTLSYGAAAQVAWQKAIPSLATSHKFVTNGVLAVGALHLSELAATDEEHELYDKIAATQMNYGMAQYRVEVQNVSTGNAEALFAFSATITAFVLFTAGVESASILKSISGGKLPAKEVVASITKLVSATCRILRGIRGVLVIIVPCWDHIQSGPLGPVVNRDWWPAAVPVTQEQVEDDQKLRQLEKMWSRPGRTYEYSFDTLRSTLKYLRESFALVSGLRNLSQSNDPSGDTPFDWTSVVQWPIALSLEFLTLLEQRRMEAWVLLAHFAILPAKFSGTLWVDSLAVNLLSTAALVIGEEEWDWIAWPANTISIDLDNLRRLPTTPSYSPGQKLETSSRCPPESLSVDLSFS
ncbi:hypothetical protein IQ07DRAFT_6104 [Pyrenochaeta sp. DS3sAY3a]|nr:hypothetical protein IQ07DRAFT_6104 [Pyrenochaeta sp. DS3sAY3a]